MGREVAELQLRHWANAPQTTNLFANLSVPVGLFHTRVFWAPAIPPQHRGLPVCLIGGTAEANYAAERMSSWFWQQRIICLFWIRRRNSSPGTGRPCSAKGALAPLAAVWTDGRGGAGHGERGPQTPMVTQPRLMHISCVTWTDLRQASLESFHLGGSGL